MIKLFCDNCGAAISEDFNRTIFKLGKVTVDVIVAVNDVWNKGHTCLECVRKTVAEGEAQERVGSLHGTLRSDA